MSQDVKKMTNAQGGGGREGGRIINSPDVKVWGAGVGWGVRLGLTQRKECQPQSPPPPDYLSCLFLLVLHSLSLPLSIS